MSSPFPGSPYFAPKKSNSKLISNSEQRQMRREDVAKAAPAKISADDRRKARNKRKAESRRARGK